MKRRIKKLLRKPYKIARLLFKIRFFKTLRVNFALLPFEQAVKLPIVVLGKLKIDSLKGKVTLDCPIKFGTVIIGKCMDNMPIEVNPTRLFVGGTLIFKGHCIINHSAMVIVWPGSEMIIGDYAVICSGVVLKSASRIVIGDYTRITSGGFVMDTNVHAIKDGVTGKVKRTFRPIEIGKCCWLAMNTSVTAGAKIPDYSISTRYAVLNRDYTESGEIGCLLAGSPAKIIRSNIQRIFDLREESVITKFFYDYPDAEYYQAEPGFEQSEDIDIRSHFTVS